MNECVCPPQCPARCTPERLCDIEDCPCYELWAVEYDGLVEATAHLSPEEIHRMAVEAWRER